MGVCTFGFGFLSRLRGTAGTIGRIRRGLLFAEVGLGVIGDPRRGAIVGVLGLRRVRPNDKQMRRGS